MDDYMRQILEATALHADRCSRHLTKKKTDLQTTVKVMQGLGRPIPAELMAALRKVDEEIESNNNKIQLTNDILTGKIQMPEEDDSADSEPEIENNSQPPGMRIQTYVDDSPNGQLTRDLNAEMADRPYFKVFVPQVFGWDEYKPFTDIKAMVTEKGATETSPAKPVGLNRHVHCDAMPKLKVAKEWAEKVDIRSPTSHREWLATDSACGSKESKAKLNRLLCELFELEVWVTFYFAKCHPSNKKRMKVIQGGMMASLMLPDDVRQSVQDIIMTHLRRQLKNLYAIYQQGCVRMWGSPIPNELSLPQDDSGDDESSAEEEDLDKPPVMSYVLTPFGPKFLQGGPKRK